MSVLVADFGGTRIKSGLVHAGRVTAARIDDTPSGATLASQLPALRARFEALAEGATFEAMVWALPCLVAADGRTITRTFGKFDDAPELDLAGWVERHFGVPLLLENDARAAAIGEWREGAGRGCSDLVMVTLGTGIGTAVISGGHPFHGSSGMGGNLGGHTVIAAGGRSCVCGQRGCAEAQVGSRALPALARESPLFASSTLARSGKIDYRTVFAEAARGDKLAAELKDRAIDGWCVLLANLIHHFDPERIVIGGGIMAAKVEILPLLESSLQRALPGSRSVPL
ncbi:ROK family protein, partial [Luteolibacter marinus]|uniref:ROK family protein n=1 Tax=Luteolibacter marinus TaxID=2776705 RepID=UPI001867E256